MTVQLAVPLTAVQPPAVSCTALQLPAQQAVQLAAQAAAVQMYSKQYESPQIKWTHAMKVTFSHQLHSQQQMQH
jgi:hypothetical protein